MLPLTQPNPDSLSEVSRSRRECSSLLSIDGVREDFALRKQRRQRKTNATRFRQPRSVGDEEHLARRRALATDVNCSHSKQKASQGIWMFNPEVALLRSRELWRASFAFGEGWWRRGELNSLPKLSALQLPRASPLYFISMPPSAGAAWAVIQFDLSSRVRYEQKLTQRSGFF